jgi:hypothetical protein
VYQGSKRNTSEEGTATGCGLFLVMLVELNKLCSLVSSVVAYYKHFNQSRVTQTDPILIKNWMCSYQIP